MNFIKKNQTLVIIVVVVAVLGIVGGYFLFKGQGKAPAPAQQGQEKPVKAVKAEDVGLTLVPRADNKAIVMKIAKLGGLSSVEYEVSYDASVTEAGQTNTIPRGAVGSPIQIKPTDTSINREILLGTCSVNVCKYDKVISAIKFVIKVSYSNGDVGSIEQAVSLPSSQ